MHVMRTLLIAVSLAAAPSALAEDLIIPYDYAGGFQADGKYANSKPGNYRVGHSPITTDPERRNFFTFDLTTFDPLPPGTLVSATLKLYVPKFAPDLGYLDPGDGYISPDPFEIYTVSPTPFTADMITDPTLTPAEAVAIFATLGTGPVAGEVAVSPADKGAMLSIPLTPDATAAINAMLGYSKLVLGGKLSSLSFIPPDELVFGFTDLGAPHMMGKAPELVLTVVPAPATLGLAAAGVMLGCRRSRRS